MLPAKPRFSSRNPSARMYVPGLSKTFAHEAPASSVRKILPAPLP
jgi:hypothetical protein